MRAIRLTVAAMVATFLIANASGTSETCAPVRLKPLHCICGKLMDIPGDPVGHGKVTVFKQGAKTVEAPAGDDGEFLIGGLKEGNYELQVEASGFKPFRFSIHLVKPEKKCKQEIEVVLTLGYPENCTRVRLVKAKADRSFRD
jgi:Carboxypeptidase regulatory-like domain